MKKYRDYTNICAFLFVLIFFNSCSNKYTTKQQTYTLLFKSEKIKFNDIILLRKNKNTLNIDTLSLGKSITNISINNQYDICLKYICYEAKEFNKKFLSSRYEDNFLDSIFRSKSIFNKKNIQKTKNGFIQKIGSITYKKTRNYVLFKDKRLRIIIKLSKI